MSAPVLTNERTGYGPPMHGGRQRSRIVTVLRTAGVALLVVLLVTSALIVGVAAYASAQIERVPVSGLSNPSGGPLHVLVVGSDSREGLTPQERQELSTGNFAGNRTDTLFVMSMQGGEIALLAFPRDLYTTRCDGSQGRINAAYAIGGAGCLVETVSTISGLPISHYLEINFGGFRDIVNAAGGVELCLDQPISDAAAGIDLPSGCQVLNGAQALGYVRVRKIDNDLERIKRQQRFVQALADKVASSDVLLNPVQLLDVVEAGGSALTAEEQLGPFDLLRLGWSMRGLASGAPQAFTVPTTSATIGGASVLQPVEAEAEALYRRFRSGAVFDGAGTAIRPQDVELRVLNGAGVTGLAGRAAELLEQRGFVVTEIGNTGQVEASVIRHAPDQADQARVLAEALPVEVPLEEAADVGQPTLILGPDAAELGT